MTKPIRSLELHYPMIQFLIKFSLSVIHVLCWFYIKNIFVLSLRDSKMEGVPTKILSRATLYIILKKYRVVARLHRGQTSEALFQVRSIEFSTKTNSTFISRKSQR